MKILRVKEVDELYPDQEKREQFQDEVDSAIEELKDLVKRERRPPGQQQESRRWGTAVKGRLVVVGGKPHRRSRGLL